MPVEIVPHMYRMLADEIQWACDEGEPYHFSHFLVLSRTFTLSGEETETVLASNQQQKRRKGAQVSSSTAGVSSFHHEDYCIKKVGHALPTPYSYVVDWTVFKSLLPTRSTFRCPTRCHVKKILLDWSKGAA